MANVLIVDDEAIVRRALRRMLENLGHRAWDVADGAAALELLGGIRFDLVISDVYMAAVDGMELLLRIHQRGVSVPVLMISGGGFLNTDEVLAMARSCGAVATLDKPFTPRQLRETIGPLLEERPAAE